MSEQADKVWVSPCPHPEAVGKRWGDPISEERQAELRALADQQREWAAKAETEKGDIHLEDSHFKFVRLTGAEAFWLAAYALAGQAGDLTAADYRLRDQVHDYGLHLPDLHLEVADLKGAHLEGANLQWAHLEAANLADAHLEGAYLGGVYMRGATPYGAHLEGAQLIFADLRGNNLANAYLERANLLGAHLERAALNGVHLEAAYLMAVYLEGADLSEVHLEGADLQGAHLEGASLYRAGFDNKTNLTGVDLDIRTHLGDIHWSGVGSVDLTLINWTPVTRLGDETLFSLTGGATAKDVENYEAAVRAYRQLAAQLRAQGMSEVADRFLYRAQVVQRRVLRKRRQFGRWVGTWLLDAVSGHGYKPMRSLIAYLLVVVGFAAVYFALGGAGGHALTWNESLVVSLTAFHGRGFFATAFLPGDPQAAVAAVEAVIGLLIEITFIATFTQRFFAR